MTGFSGSPFWAATLMMAVVGLVAAGSLRFLRIRSLRLQAILLTAVLAQGVMLFRLPIHLGFWPAQQANSTDVFDGTDVSTGAIAPLDDSHAMPGPFENRLVEESGQQLDSQQSRFACGEMLASVRVSDALVVLWVSGTAIILLVSLVNYFRLVFHVGRLHPAGSRFQNEWRDVLREFRLSPSKCRLLFARCVGPMVVRTPRSYAMVVPEQYWHSLSTIQRKAVMMHEAEHLVRRDVWRQLAARMVASIHWFNPMGWWAARRLDFNAEFACDNAVARRGDVYSAGFASALVALVSQNQPNPSTQPSPLGCLSMAAPPLTRRVSQLLQPSTSGDSVMKRIVFFMVAALVGLASCFQFHLTAADSEANNGGRSANDGQLRVLADETSQKLQRLMSKMDTTDQHTAQFVTLLDSDGGKMAIGSYLDQLRGNALRDARSDAMAKYVEYRFERTGEGLVLRDDEIADRLRKYSERLGGSIKSLDEASAEIAEAIENDPSDVAMLMKRFLKDPQSSVALLLAEKGSGGDPIAAYINKVLGKVLVERGDGKFQVFDSAREKAQELVRRFELAGGIAKRLRRQLPVFAAELDGDFEPQKEMIRYFHDPVTAEIVALHLSEKSSASAAELVEKIFESLESACDESPTGLRVREGEAMDQINEIFRIVDRAKSASDRVKERLLEIADAMTDDDLSQKLAELARGDAMAMLLAAEIPYADNMAGNQFRAQLDEVLTETSDGGLKIRSDRAEELAEHLKGLLQACRQIRRHGVTVEEILEKMADKKLVADLGENGKYVLLNQIRNHAMSHQVDAVELLQKDLLESDGDSKTRVRSDKRELVERLVQAAKGLNERGGADDF